MSKKKPEKKREQKCHGGVTEADQCDREFLDDETNICLFGVSFVSLSFSGLMKMNSEWTKKSLKV
jgi:hypothetical protein